MILYIEKSTLNLKQTQIILNNFPNSQILVINNYKNLFDRDFPSWLKQRAVILSSISWTSLIEAPESYWHHPKSFFLKNSLNCIFDCRYCFLKWAFKNDYPVFFLNYDFMKAEIQSSLSSFEEDYNLRFYSSDYSDNLAMNSFSNFVENFVPFFESLNWAMLEIRTKSSNISSLISLGFVPKNTEIAFSLNPQKLIDKYEKATSSLESRIESINTLLELWFKVWLRFLPLLPIPNYRQIYTDFVEEIKRKIDLSKVSSSFASGLLFTKSDYNVILHKDPSFDLLYYLKEQKDWFMREDKHARDFFYKLFLNLDKNCKICLDDIYK